MGVSGSGKTTLGKALSQRLGWPLVEGDEFHSRRNIQKMSTGIPLTDDDRWPWLMRLRTLLQRRLRAQKPVIMTCSALKESYRTYLKLSPRVRLVYLKGSPGLLRARLRRRRGHYMKVRMLASQLAALEEPRTALVVQIARPIPFNVDRIVRELNLHPTNAD